MIAANTNAPASTLPVATGFYWAKWQRADQGDAKTEEYESYLPEDRWIIVEVIEDNGPEDLRVFVAGAVDTQSPENFTWGPGPLLPPLDGFR